MTKNRRIVIVGTGGRLGAAMARAYAGSAHVVGFNHAQLDLSDQERIRHVVGELDFDLMINCAAQTNVDRCEAQPREAFAINAEAPRTLAEMAAKKNAALVHVSTDYVFDGEKSQPYTEDDAAHPISVYGESKLAGEKNVLTASTRHLVVRVSWVFGPDRPSFVDWIIQQAREKETVAAVADKFSVPTYAVDVAAMLRPLVLEENGDHNWSGILHLANGGSCSWQEYGQWALDCCREEGVQLRAQRVDSTSLAAMKQFVARRPVHTALATEKYTRLSGQTSRSWQDAVRDYVRDHIAPALLTG